MSYLNTFARISIHGFVSGVEITHKYTTPFITYTVVVNKMKMGKVLPMFFRCSLSAQAALPVGTIVEIHGDAEPYVREDGTFGYSIAVKGLKVVREAFVAMEALPE